MFRRMLYQCEVVSNRFMEMVCWYEEDVWLRRVWGFLSEWVVGSWCVEVGGEVALSVSGGSCVTECVEDSWILENIITFHRCESLQRESHGCILFHGSVVSSGYSGFHHQWKLTFHNHFTASIWPWLLLGRKALTNQTFNISLVEILLHRRRRLWTQSTTRGAGCKFPRTLEWDFQHSGLCLAQRVTVTGAALDQRTWSAGDGPTWSVLGPSHQTSSILVYLDYSHDTLPFRKPGHLHSGTNKGACMVWQDYADFYVNNGSLDKTWLCMQVAGNKKI